MNFILAPLRGVTIRCFRETFAAELASAGFAEAITPFITAAPGFDPLKDRELRTQPGTSSTSGTHSSISLTPQFIGKDPAALRACLLRVRDAGYETADLNCGCPFPMVRNKGRGSGLLRTPDVLRRMLEAGCEVMGPGRFSAKTRLGVESPDEIFSLLPLFNEFPLRFLAVHARTAKQMYAGTCDAARLARVVAESRNRVVPNGDLAMETAPDGAMIGRAFVRSLGARPDSCELLLRYLDASSEELGGQDRSVLGRLKELLSYWKDIPFWRRKWDVLKICRTCDELRAVLKNARPPLRIR